MEFEKLKKIIAEVLNVDEEEITMETTFVSLWGLKRNLTLRLQMKMQNIL